MTQYLSQLNETQKKAVETTEGPILVLAGAGTGKTRVLTSRFAHILLSGKAYPNQILAVTFTNKASREMSERIASLINKPVEGLWLGSFHKICARMLRQNATLVGLTSNFTILDTDDQLRLIKQITPAYSIDTKRVSPQLILGTIQFWKDKGYSPDNLPNDEINKSGNSLIKTIYAHYQKRLREINACDFGDLMLHMFNIFSQHQHILEKYQRYFTYIMVDEYQDTNMIQYLWLKLLAQKNGQEANICCVGDDDQSIYSWRGADITNILRFERDFPGAKIIRLENNYRSTSSILGAASGLISFNSQRLGKTLHAANATVEGEKIKILSTYDSDEEARIICKNIIDFHKKEQQFGDMAILMRTSSQTRPFEECMIKLGIPYKIISGVRFYERAEIRDVIAYMRTVAQPSDDLAFERIINVPKRGIGKAALQKLHLLSRESNISLTMAAQQALNQGIIRGKVASELNQLMLQLEMARSTSEKAGHFKAIDDLIHHCGYIEMWQQNNSVESEGRLENIRELFRAMSEFQSLNEFLEHISLIMDNDELSGDDKVNLMTLHAAKGLEFDTVFLPGWEEGLFPSQRTLDENGLNGLEEERRLAYVGITRARRNLVISYAANRQIYGNWQSAIPSRFIEELPNQFIVNPSIRINRNHSNPNYFDNLNFGKKQKGTRDTISFGNIFTPNKQRQNLPKSKNIPVGARVFHQKFGYGTVLKTEQNKLEINFDKTGIKNVIDSFVTETS